MRLPKDVYELKHQTKLAVMRKAGLGEFIEKIQEVC